MCAGWGCGLDILFPLPLTLEQELPARWPVAALWAPAAHSEFTSPGCWFNLKEARSPALVLWGMLQVPLAKNRTKLDAMPEAGLKRPERTRWVSDEPVPGKLPARALLVVPGELLADR